ncbi:MAG: secondary thiamine-phosphate synthase enzyme YjbQ [Candidatus Gastranaerophilales bacterium]|nr:secondary thiamine-phosphate synthase enzyme YjbQ [Candidatus Gastranaerophilales bacterium]
MLLNAKFVIMVNPYDLTDLTDRIYATVKNLGLKNASICIHTPFSLASIGVMEYDPGLVKDFFRFINKILPLDSEYEHNIEWKDNFAHSYIKTLLIGNSVTIPFINGEFELDRFQRILLFNFADTKGARSVIMQMIY